MTRLAGASIEADTVSDAWLLGVRAIHGAAGRSVHHLVTRITDPTREDVDLRGQVDSVLAEQDLPPVETVANTIFPAAMARQNPEPAELGERYRASYRRIRRFKGNEGGTYFGRMVDYPHPERGSVDQLAELVRKLRDELGQKGPIHARYEVAPSLPEPEAAETTSSGQPAGDRDTDHADAVAGPDLDGEVKIAAPGYNAGRIGFPCLSWCSFQLDDEHLHLVAHYRSQYLIQRGYGNYLALARLQRYIADAAGLHTGQLMIVAGYAKLDGRRWPVQQLLRENAEAA